MNKNYIEVTNYLIFNAETIKSKYRRYFLNNYLTEDYRPFNIEPRNVFATLMTVAYEYNRETNKSDNVLLDMLNNAFQYIHVIFKKSPEESVSSKYPRSGIVSGESDPNGYFYIEVNDKFLSTFNSVDLTKENKSLEYMTEDLMKIYGHEYTHLYQLDKQKVLVPGIDKNDLDVTDIFTIKKYLSHQREIDAHAREIAVELLLTGKTVNELKQIIKNLFNDEKLISLSRVFGQYWYLFSKFSHMNTYPFKNDNNILLNLKKKILEFLDMDKDKINKNSLIALLKQKL